MIKLADILKEATYDYACAMLYFNFPEINKIHSLIDKNDIYEEPDDDSYGLETEPHCTLLYGIHGDVSIEGVINSIKDIEFSDCKVYNPSLFENEKYDVLKFNVSGVGLHEANAVLKRFPYTTDYPKYNPHLTLAYLKPKTGQRYVELLKTKELVQFKLRPIYGVYSHPSGWKTKFKINLDN